MLTPVPLPYRGVADNTPFIDQPGDAAPPATMRNARVDEPEAGRRRMSRRPGLAKLIARKLGSGPVQALAPITRASTLTGYVVPAATPSYDPCTDLTAGTSKLSGTFHGNVFLIDQVAAMAGDYLLSVAGESPAGPATVSVVAVAVSPDGAYIAVAANYTDTTLALTRAVVRVLNAATLAMVSEAVLPQSGSDTVYVNTLCFTSSYLVVCGYKFLAYTYHAGVLAAVAEASLIGSVAAGRTLNGWAGEVVQAARVVLGGIEYLLVGFNGSTGAGTRTGGVIEAGLAAEHFRSGVVKLQCSAPEAIPLGGAAFLWVAYPSAGDIAGSDPYWEANHRYFRVSERTGLRPHGCQITALAVASDGSVVVGRTNQGWGPTYAAADAPDGASNAPISFFKIDVNGGMVFENDHGSVIELSQFGWFNDIPYPGDTTPDPSVNAVAVDARGDIYLGGRTNGSGACAFKCSGLNGMLVWQTALQSALGVIRQAAVAIDPTDSAPVFGGDENTSWSGSGGRDAHAWKLDPGNGQVVDAFDLEDQTAPSASGVSVLGVAVLASGDRVLVTDQF